MKSIQPAKNTVFRTTTYKCKGCGIEVKNFYDTKTEIKEELCYRCREKINQKENKHD